MNPASTSELHNVPIIYLPDDAIVVPGLSGEFSSSAPHRSGETPLSDSHGHLLEYGASRQLPLEGTTTISGNIAHVNVHLSSADHRSISSPRNRCPRA
jgi:hypothetical protein